MKMKISDLCDIALDWAAAKCEGLEVTCYGRGLWYGDSIDSKSYEWHPTINWAQGGPIIEREKIRLWNYDEDNLWEASIAGMPEGKHRQYGPTPLIAAMRCYVASKLGDEVEIPNELLDK